MKKTILIIGLVVLALGIFSVGVALAQDAQPPVGRGSMTLAPGASAGVGGYGAMHYYVEEALADKLGITEADVENALASGKTMYQIALDNGVKEAVVAAFLTEVHITAFDKAVADAPAHDRQWLQLWQLPDAEWPNRTIWSWQWKWLWRHDGRSIWPWRYDGRWTLAAATFNSAAVGCNKKMVALRGDHLFMFSCVRDDVH